MSGNRLPERRQNRDLQTLRRQINRLDETTEELSGPISDARVVESSVTQHQQALTIQVEQVEGVDDRTLEVLSNLVYGDSGGFMVADDGSFIQGDG